MGNKGWGFVSCVILILVLASVEGVYAETYELQQTFNPDIDNFGFAVTGIGDNVLIGAMWTKKVSLYDGTTGELMHIFSNSDAAGFGYSLASSGDNILIGAIDARKIYLYDGTTYELLQTFENPDVNYFGLSMASIGNNVLTGTHTVGKAFIYDGTTGELMHTFTEYGSAGFGHKVASVGDNVLIGAYGSGTAYLYNGITYELLHTFSNPASLFGKSVASVGHNILIGAPGDKKAFLYDGITYELLQTFSNPAANMFGTEVAGAGDKVLVGTQYAGEAYLYDGDTGELLQTFSNPNGPNSDPYPWSSDAFGNSVAGVGEKVLIGAYFSKSAYLYAQETDTASPLETPEPIDGPPTVSISVSTQLVTAEEPFYITVTGTDDVGLATIGWWGNNTGDTALDMEHWHNTSGTSATYTWTVTTPKEGVLNLCANSRDSLYPTIGEPHQASEGQGISCTTINVTAAQETTPPSETSESTPLSPQLQWSYAIGPSFSSPAVADLDGDGYIEVVVASSDGNLYSIDADGNKIWEFNFGGTYDSSPAIYDLDGDGDLEIIVGSSNKKVYVVDHNGNEVWSYTTGYTVHSSPAVADIDGDGKQEVVIASDLLYAFNEDGSLLWSRSIGGWNFGSSPAIADIDGDGKLEIVIGSYYGYVLAVNGEDGSVLWKTDTVSWPSHRSTPAIADLDGDGDLEIVIGSGADIRNPGYIFALNHEGGILWTYQTGSAVLSSPAVADLDGDGSLEVVVQSFDGNVYSIDYQGNLMWTYPAKGYSSPVIVDIDNDSIFEIIVGSVDKKVYVISNTGEYLWSYLTGGYVHSSAAVADIDRDQIPEILIGSFDGNLYAIDTGGSSGEGEILWKMFHHDECRTGSSNDICQVQVNPTPETTPPPETPEPLDEPPTSSDIIPLNFTSPSSSESGGIVGSELHLEVKNNGTTDANASAGYFSIGFYISNDTTWDASDVLLKGGRESVDTPMAPGETKVVSIYSGMSIPSSTSPGNYYLLAVVDEIDALNESDETNNVVANFIVIADTTPPETTTITGTILYNGMPIVGFTEKTPIFWARDEGSKQAFPLDPSYNVTTGEYTIPNVPPGKYGISVTIDDAEPFNTGNGFAGDFNGWESPIIVPEGQSVLQKDLDVERTIHLTSPVDNSREIGSLGAEKDSYGPDDLAFTWDVIPEAASYKVSVYRYEEEPFSYLDNFLSVSIEDTNLQPSLPPSEDNQFYMFKLYAYNTNGLMVGKLMVHYDNGHGWDYRFRIVQNTTSNETTPPSETPKNDSILRATVDIRPDTLNLKSKGVFTAYITLPGEYDVEDIDVDTITCEGAQAVRTSIENGTLVAHFNRKDIKVEAGDEVTMSVMGLLGNGTQFEGQDIIRVTNPSPKTAPSAVASGGGGGGGGGGSPSKKTEQPEVTLPEETPQTKTIPDPESDSTVWSSSSGTYQSQKTRPEKSTIKPEIQKPVLQDLGRNQTVLSEIEAEKEKPKKIVENIKAMVNKILGLLGILK